MRIFALILILTFAGQSFGQNLIDRTKLGLSCQSTDEPNRLSKEIGKLKSSSDIDLLTWDNRKSDNILDLVMLQLNRKHLSKLTSDNTEAWAMKVPVSTNRSFIVRLKSFKVQSEGGQLLTPEGPVSSTNDMKFYRGVIDGDHGSLVTASIINGVFHMSITDQDGNYRISPTEYKSDNYSIWMDHSMSEREFTCGTDDSNQLERHSKIEIVPQKGDNLKAAGDVIEVYVECDNELHNDKGGVSGTETFVTQLFAEIITLYANEGINMEVSDIFVWTSVDPYAGNENLNTVLDQFSINRMDNYNGRLATLLKGNITNSCSIAGLANVDVLCNNFSNGGFGPYGPYNVNRGIGYCSTIGFDELDVSVVAHELGHNIGSPHTHACEWGPNEDQRIDNCGFEGSCSLVVDPTPDQEYETIMSYCNPTDLTKGFGTEPGNLLRSKVAAASCLAPGGDPCTHVNRTYNNTTIASTTVRADNNITLLNTVNVSTGSLINWSFENEFVVNGTLTVPNNAQLEIMVEDCQ